MNSLALLAALLAAPATDDEPAPALPLDMSADFVEVTGRSRFHLVTRFAPGAVDTWAIEASAAIRVFEGGAITLGVPFGHINPDGPPRSSFYFGNFRVGFAGGAAIALDDDAAEAMPPTLRFGGALDLYVPTRPAFEPKIECNPACNAGAHVAPIRPLDPGMFLGGAFSGRARASLGFDVSYFGLSAEAGALPLLELGADPRGYLWLSYGARLRGVIPPYVELFAEIAGSSALLEPAAPSYRAGAVYATPGLRLHFSAMSLAAFASLRVAGEAADYVFGIDLGGAAPRQTRQDRELYEPLTP